MWCLSQLVGQLVVLVVQPGVQLVLVAPRVAERLQLAALRASCLELARLAVGARVAFPCQLRCARTGFLVAASSFGLSAAGRPMS